MPPLPRTPELLAIAQRVIWFEPPEKALSDTARFMAYAMANAGPQDMAVIRTYVSDQQFLAAIDAAPPGIIDPRSWSYWNLVVANRHPPPPVPRREFR